MGTVITWLFKSISPLAKYDAPDRHNPATTLNIGHETTQNHECGIRQRRQSVTVIASVGKTVLCDITGT
jgi:hypothetical protein